MSAGPVRVYHLDTERGWRGGERQVLWLARALAAAGHHSVVAARPGERLHAAATSEALAVRSVAPRLEFDVVAAWALRRELVRERVEILHAHTGHAVGLGALATVGTETSLVVTRRVDFPLGRNAATRWKYRRARAVIAISSAVKEVLVASGIPADHVTVVPSGIDLRRTIEPAAADTLCALGLVPDLPLVVMVAALVPHKSPTTFVRAVATAARGVRLQALLVGDGPLVDAVRQEREALGLGATLRLAGQRADADALIAAADVVVLSSREEGLGTVLLDAMMCAKPVAATSAGGIPDVVVDGQTGLLAPVDDADALGSAIARLCSDPALRVRLGRAARERAQLFSVERMAGETVAVYRRVLAERG